MASRNLLLTFYGDDFSGSTDVMEALSVHGVPSVLFLAPPTGSDLARFPECRAVGLAGTSRSESPEWMDANLPGAFSSLKELSAPICHYKTCSTFDSSPTRGSIGRAVELGGATMGTTVVPMVVGAPALKRYVTFGNLFATVNGVNFRLDRHPTMSCHPVTPMHEADLRLHLAGQTSLPTALVDILALRAGRGLEGFQDACRQGARIVLFDTLDAASLAESGRAIWESRGEGTTFVAGSSGVEYALLAWWKAQGLLPAAPQFPDAGPEARLLVVSGSCSPGTGKQIEWAQQNGFEGLPLNPQLLVSGEAEWERALRTATGILERGGSPVLYTAAGPQDAIIDNTDVDFGKQLGIRLGSLATELLRRSGIRRMVVAGGDTSGRVGQALGIKALTMVRPFAPGSPLCRVWSDNAAADGLEILFKGGQVGGEALFGEVRQGRPN